MASGDDDGIVKVIKIPYNCILNIIHKLIVVEYNIILYYNSYGM